MNPNTRVNRGAQGLQHDLAIMEARLHQRRQALSWLLATGTTALVAACGGGGSTASINNFGSISIASDNVFGDNSSAQIHVDFLP